MHPMPIQIIIVVFMISHLTLSTNCDRITVLYNGVMEGKMSNESSTLDKILFVARHEFLKKGFKSASLRNIVREAGLTTGAFYGYYKSKEELFDALVGEQYKYIATSYEAMQDSFISGADEAATTRYMFDMLDYTNKYHDEFMMLLNASEGTRYENFIDQIVEDEAEIRAKSAKDDAYTAIHAKLEHMLLTGMLHTFFEVVQHNIPSEEAHHFVGHMCTFYLAGFKAIRED